MITCMYIYTLCDIFMVIFLMWVEPTGWNTFNTLRVRLFCLLEALEAELQGVSPRLVLLPVHHRRHRLWVLHDHRHLAVPLSQHAPVVDVGGACKEEGGVSWSANRGRQSTGLVAGLVADWLRRVHFKSRLWNSEGKSEFFEKFMILCFITESLPTKQEMWI